MALDKASVICLNRLISDKVFKLIHCGHSYIKTKTCDVIKYAPYTS